MTEKLKLHKMQFFKRKMSLPLAEHISLTWYLQHHFPLVHCIVYAFQCFPTKARVHEWSDGSRHTASAPSGVYVAMTMIWMWWNSSVGLRCEVGHALYVICECLHQKSADSAHWWTARWLYDVPTAVEIPVKKSTNARVISKNYNYLFKQIQLNIESK